MGYSLDCVCFLMVMGIFSFHLIPFITFTFFFALTFTYFIFTSSPFSSKVNNICNSLLMEAMDYVKATTREKQRFSHIIQGMKDAEKNHLRDEYPRQKGRENCKFP